MLLGLSAGAWAGCGPNQPAQLSSDAVYTNDYYVPGVGYYHAPYRAWYPLPYNHFDPKTQQYYYGGQWSATPCESITNISAPTAGTALQTEAQRTDVARGGFGSSSSTYFVSS